MQVAPIVLGNLCQKNHVCMQTQKVEEQPLLRFFFQCLAMETSSQVCMLLNMCGQTWAIAMILMNR